MWGIQSFGFEEAWSHAQTWRVCASVHEVGQDKKMRGVWPQAIAAQGSRIGAPGAAIARPQEGKRRSGVGLTPDLSQTDDDFGGFEHVLNADPFVSRVVVLLAGEDIGGGQSVEGELGAVGAASDGHFSDLKAGFADGALGVGGDVGELVEDGTHVSVLDLVFVGEGGAGMGVDGGLGEAEEEVFFLGEFVGVKIAQNELDGGGIDAGFDVNGVDEAFAIAGRFGGKGIFGEAIDELRDELDGVDHLAVGVPGMRVDAFEGERHGVGAEGFGVEHSARGGVHGIGAVGVEFFDVEVGGAAADFFVRGEGDADVAVLDFGVFEEVLGGGHDGGHAGFVVGAKEGGAGRGDDVVSDLFGEFGIVGKFDDDVVSIGQDDVLSLVILVEDGLDVCAADFGRGVDVCDEADGFDGAGGVGGQGGGDVSVRIEFDVLQSHGAAFIAEKPEEIELFGGRRIGRALGVGLGVDFDVTRETVEQGVIIRSKHGHFLCVLDGFRPHEAWT